MKYTTLSAGEMRKLHGKSATIETNIGEICKGKISVDNGGAVYLVHFNRNAEGSKPEKMFGYDYGWCLYSRMRFDSYMGNINYKWIEIHDEEPKKDKPTLEVIQPKKVKYSDDDTVYSDGGISICSGLICQDYTPEQLQEHIKKARRVLARYKKLSF